MAAHSISRRSLALLGAAAMAALLAVAARLSGQAVEVWTKPLNIGHTPVALPLGSNHFIMSMTADHLGNLWMGTEGEGVFRYNPAKPEKDQWLQFVPSDGLGDEFGYAMACDHRGRIWVGHVNHGVSVFNVDTWKIYEPVAGLSKKGTLAGPLGEHVTAIAVSPVDGDVWIATNAGLSRYSDAKDTWSYITRSDGLPSDQPSSLAFDRDGTLYVGMQCDGLAIASPADGYTTWKQANGPDVVALTGAGKGLPINEINALCVARDHTVYAATPYGLAWSADKGTNWQFTRGADWVSKAQQVIGGPPAGWVAPAGDAPGGAILAEDCCTALAEDADGNILVGHTLKPADLVAPRAARKIASGEDYAVTCFYAPPGSRNMYAGTNGKGMIIENLDKNSPIHLPEPDAVAMVKMPSGATPKLPKLVVAPERAKVPALQFIGDDWMTQGDWVGRYGRQYAVHCAENSPSDGVYAAAQNIRVTPNVDPAYRGKQDLRLWLDGASSDSPSSLWSPSNGLRRESQWNDHGEAGPALEEGPNLWLSVAVPEGTYRISLYFYPFREHTHAVDREFRDFYVRAGVEPEGAAPFEELAHTRVTNFDGGVYKQFLVQGGQTYRFILERRYSYNMIVDGVFVDRLAGPQGPWAPGALAAMGNSTYGPPPMPAKENLPPALQEIVPGSLFDVDHPPTAATLDRAQSVLCYRAAVDAEAEPSLLTALRWQVPLWTAKDRNDWNAAMAQGFEGFLQMNPGMADRLRQQNQR